MEIHDYDEIVIALTSFEGHVQNTIKLDINLKNRESPPAKPSMEEPPILELKVLLSHLKYTFLGAYNTLTVIIATGFLEY